MKKSVSFLLLFLRIDASKDSILYVDGVVCLILFLVLIWKYFYLIGGIGDWVYKCST